MRKYLLIIFVMSICSSLMFASTLTTDNLGIKKNGGSATDPVVGGDVIEVKGEVTISGYTGEGEIYTLAYFSTVDRLRIYWNDAVNGGGTLFNWEYVSSVSYYTSFEYDANSSGSYIVRFTLPSPPTTARSFCIRAKACGEDDSGYVLGTNIYSYDDTMTGYATYINLIIDTTTETPTMTLPADSQHDDNPTGIEFSLPEAGYDGTVKLSFTRSGEDHECTILSETQGTHSFNIDPTSLSSASEIGAVTGGNTLTANVPYTVTIEYQDALQNAIASDSNTGYVYDTVTETPTLDVPANLAVIDQEFSIVYDQPEIAMNNTVKITFTRTGGTSDPGSPHVLIVESEASGTDIHIAFNGSDLGAASGVTLDSGFGILVSGAIYSIKFEYQDFLGNSVSSDTNISISYSTDAIIYASGGDYGAASFTPGSDNNPFFRFQLYWNNTGTQPTVTSIEFDILGTYTGGEFGDVKWPDGMKLWRSTNSTFGSDTQIGAMNIADPLIFSGLSELIPTNNGYYYFLTVDVSSTASGSDAIGAEIDQASDITTAATVSGSFPISGSEHPLPVTMSSFTAQFTNGSPTLYWTTQSETNNMGWNLYRSISQNMGQGILVNIGGLIPGQGTTSEPTDYIYTDQNGVVENTTYWYWLESVDNGGETEMFGPISLTIPLGGGNSGTPVAPGNYGLYQNYPNPFNPSTKIRFALEESGKVILTIYNTKGQKIQTYEVDVQADIVESVLWDGRDNFGKQVASGIYLYELKTPKETFIRKMILTK